MFFSAPTGADLAIDLGSRNTLVVSVQRGSRVQSVPTRLLFSISKQRYTAIGAEASLQSGLNGGTEQLVFPIEKGLVAHEEALRFFLRRIMAAALPGAFLRPRLLLLIPSDAHPSEQTIFTQCGLQAGARQVTLLPSVLASALGTKLPITGLTPSFIADIGSQTVKIALMTLGGFITRRSAPMGGDSLDQAIAMGLRRKGGWVVDQHQAEALKTRGPGHLIHAHELGTGRRRSVTLSDAELRVHASAWLDQLGEEIQRALVKAPPELARELCQNGLSLAGGAAQLSLIADELSVRLKMPVKTTDRPERCVALGLANLLQNPSLVRRHQVLT